MSRKIRVMLVFTLVSLILVIQVLSASAYITYGGNHKLTYGVHNRYTWYDSTTIDSTLHSYIVSARDDWNNTATHVWFIETTYKPNSVMDFYHGEFFDRSLRINAGTAFYVSNTQIDPSSQDYGWTRIYLNLPFFDSLSTSALVDDGRGNLYYINRKKSVIAHEMSHVFGLDHVSDIYSLMYPNGDLRKVDWPTQDEISGVNFLYP